MLGVREAKRSYAKFCVQLASGSWPTTGTEPRSHELQQRSAIRLLKPYRYLERPDVKSPGPLSFKEGFGFRV